MNRTIYILFVVWVFLQPINILSQQILINEVLPSNISSFMDEDGDYPDWIELYNNSDETISLFDYGLTDDMNEPFKWILPNVRLTPNEIFVIYASGKNKTEWFTNWETIIDHGDNWQYQIGNEDIPQNWNSLDYTEYWNEDPSGFGYGDDDDATIVDSSTISVFIKKEFEIDDKNDIQAAILHLDYDDGFVAYLNGVEIARANLGNVGEVTLYNELAVLSREPNMIDGGKPETFRVENLESILKDGTNILAIQGHNSSNISSDLSIIPFFTISRKSVTNYVNNTPDILEKVFLNLHTNFSISSTGEEIILSNKYGDLEDAVQLPGLLPDVSFGRSTDYNRAWGVFYEPTPWEHNNSEIYSQVVDKPKFSKKAGFYSDSFFLEFENTISDIYYTRDGSEPDENSLYYSTPIYISSTTVIRAKSYHDNTLPSTIVTNTYFINEKSELPIISISTAPENLWDDETGIYVDGLNAEDSYPYLGANYWNDWEKPIHIEMFETNGDNAFSIDAGVKIFGAGSRVSDQKSLAIHARALYGTKEISHKIFPNLNIDKFGSLVLRNSGNDWASTLFRDGLMHSLVKKTSLDIQAHRPSIVFLNGKYWGIHNIREKKNEEYLSKHHNIDKEKIDIIFWSGDVIAGNDNEYLKFINFLETKDLSTDENYQKLLSYIDIDNFIEYYAAEIYFDNSDWPGNNLQMWREQTDSAKFRMIFYDLDYGFGSGLFDPIGFTHNTLELATTTLGNEWPNPPASTFILRKLLGNDKIKNKFINQFSRYFNTLFSFDKVENAIDRFEKQIENEIPRHIEKWKTMDFNKWQDNIGVLHQFNLNRAVFVKEFLQNKFMLTGIAKVNINNHNPEMGKIFFDKIEIKDSTWQGEYFQDSEVQLVADAKRFYAFSHWMGDINSNEPILEVSLSEINNFTAVFEPKEDSSEVVINEINYNSNSDYNPQDWIELFNPTENDIDISGWIFNDSKLDSNFVIPVNTILKTNHYIVLTEDSTSFKNIFPNVNNFIGDFPFKLNNDGEYITLYNKEELVDSVKYNDKNPWPIKPDGKGQTLELINYKLDNNNPENWGRSYFNGTPGKINDRYLKSKITNEVSQILLFQNYPNPFNSSTEIEYALATDSRVRIEIFDVLGKRVRLLKDKDLKSGFYSVYWDGKNDVAQSVSSGIYFYSINNSVEILTKKMIYLK
ncbi:MAG: T9SS type A sorting domain-containing protein [Ignavibacteriae bacterium]|nr:T9SS type A sorting domain-containing protein [Ignavibacteriota bacterium]